MKGRSATRPPLRVFYSYAHADEALRAALEKHLSLLQRQGFLQGWHDRNISAGNDWRRQIDQHLEAAQLILLLISPDFLHSDYCHDIEMQRALERHDHGEAWVIPIHLRPVDWEGAAFGRLQALPTNARAVTEWDNQDTAFRNIAQGLRKAVHAIRDTDTDVRIVHSNLAASGGISWKWLVGVCMLLVAMTLGWFVYAQHTAHIAQYLAEGKRFLDTGQYEQAKEAYRQALARCWLDKRGARFGLALASVYDSADGAFHPDVIKQRIDRLLAQAPNDPHPYLFLGDLYMLREAYEQAREFYHKAIALDPTLAQGYFSLGVVYDKLGEPENALAMGKQAVQHAAWNPTYLNNLAYHYLRHKDYDKAITTYQQALFLDGTFLLTYFEMANYYRALGQPENVLRYQQKGVELLNNPKIAALQTNDKPWYFSLEDQYISLDTLADKQCYAYRSLAATLRVLQRTTEAEQYEHAPCVPESLDAQAIEAWVQEETPHLRGVSR